MQFYEQSVLVLGGFIYRLHGLVHLCGSMWISSADVSGTRLCFVNRNRWWWYLMNLILVCGSWHCKCKDSWYSFWRGGGVKSFSVQKAYTHMKKQSTIHSFDGEVNGTHPFWAILG